MSSDDAELALSVLSLNEEERIVETISAEYEEVREVFGTSREVKHKFTGYLFLTTDRLIFVADRGLDFQIRVGMPYEVIAQLDTGSYASGLVEVITRMGGRYRFKVRGHTKNSELKLASRVKELQIDRQARLEKEKKRKGVQLILDFSFLRPLAEKGIVLQALRCPHCGGKIDELPETGNLFECHYCGNKVYATDIYREINRLLGYNIDQISSNNIIDDNSAHKD